MPEKGWEIITVRSETKKALMKVSRTKAISINKLIVLLLDKGVDKKVKVST